MAEIQHDGGKTERMATRMSKESSSGGIGLPTVLVCVFVVLKLTENIQWPWIWVLSPIWISLAITLLVFVCVRLFDW